MADTIAKDQFMFDLKIQTLVQQKQFEQWLTSTFYINDMLSKSKKYDYIYQDTFYVKLYELLTEGLNYADMLHGHLSINLQKKDWYAHLITGLNDIIASLEEEEFNYIEYRRHSASHIFQDQYEYIQKGTFKIKSIRKGKDLKLLISQLESLVIKFGSDQNIDLHLNAKLQPKLSALYKTLTNLETLHQA